MPLKIEPRGTPSGHTQRAPEAQPGLVLGLVNNMPDSALEATEKQFSGLLQAAAGPLSVELRYAYLPEVVRSAEALEYVRGKYWRIDELQTEAVDAIIVTGAEPLAPTLSEEPYWQRFVQLLQWAQDHTISSIWSCLAAHGAALQLGQVQRRRLDAKRFGVFEHELLPGHALTRGIGGRLRIPHSRWNEVPVTELRQAGFTIVSWSSEAGADIFTKETRSLLVFLQGHPEYEDLTLMKEYRRDVGRFLRGQQTRYPNLPENYFSAEALEALADFKTRAMSRPDAQLVNEFPSEAISAGLTNTWHAAAAALYRNWLRFIADAKTSGRKAATAGVL